MFEAPQAAGAGGEGGVEPPQGGTSGVVETGGIGGAAGTVSPPAGVSQLRFSVLTRPLGGTYAPKNIGAIWISDAAGQHVRTLELWASIRRRYLEKWNTATGGDRADVVSRATLRMHEPHEVIWDLNDKAGMRVAPGSYQLTIETTDRSGAGQFQSVSFMLDEPLELAPAETPYYASMRLAVE